MYAFRKNLYLVWKLYVIWWYWQVVLEIEVFFSMPSLQRTSLGWCIHVKCVWNEEQYQIIYMHQSFVELNCEWWRSEAGVVRKWIFACLNVSSPCWRWWECVVCWMCSLIKHQSLHTVVTNQRVFYPMNVRWIVIFTEQQVSNWKHTDSKHADGATLERLFIPSTFSSSDSNNLYGEHQACTFDCLLSLKLLHGYWAGKTCIGSREDMLSRSVVVHNHTGNSKGAIRESNSI